MSRLQYLECYKTEIADLAPLAGIASLQHLDCSETKVADLSALAGLTSLQYLNCSRTRVADLAPLAGLPRLRDLNCSYCELGLAGLRAVLAQRPVNLVLYESRVRGIPAEVLSTHSYENCLNFLRAHFADIDSDGPAKADTKLLLLGNGRVGKTQIGRWLAGLPYQQDSETTHGIQIARVAAPGATDVWLQIWDFGGQDIYHGTHALFLRHPAVTMLVWAAACERDSHSTHGLDFRNYPLPYWVALARQQGHRDSPILIVQNQVDQPGQRIRRAAELGALLEGLAYPPPELHLSARLRQGQGTLLDALTEAMAWLQNQQGIPQIGAGRLRVQRRIEALREADRALPPAQRQNQVMNRATFDAICAEEGGVTSTEALLHFLDANGTVLYRPEVMPDRIVLDQDWALGAIYTLFDRQGVFQTLRRDGGRFTRGKLALMAWRDRPEAEQRLFLDLMRACRMCFEHRRFEDDAEYIAPDLLPDRAEVAGNLAAMWDDQAPGEERRVRYKLLHDGLIRAIMARIGQEARLGALYWQGGLAGFEATTRSHYLIEQQRAPGAWDGRIRIATQGGQAALLLERLMGLLREAEAEIGLRSEAQEAPAAKPAEPVEQPPLHFTQPKPQAQEYYVSYAWGDATPEGQARERAVESLCEAARARGVIIQRDRDVLSFGDSISAFMRRLGAGDRVFVILSDKYLRSPNCMFELSEIWRNCRQESPAFRERVVVWALPDANVWTHLDWTDWAIHWKQEHDALAQRAHDHSVAILGEAGQRRLTQMLRFWTQVADMLASLADGVQPRTLESILDHGLR
jgi:internalin A